MRFVRAVMLVGIGAIGALGVQRWLLPPVLPTSGGPAIERIERSSSDPPLVWIGGSLEEVGATELILRDGEGPAIAVERFAGDATRFYVPDQGRWRELAAEEVETAAEGKEACLEALADGESFLAIRVFIDRICAPT